MSEINYDNKYDGRSRIIAKNSIVLFVRMFIITMINLYSVRLVLAGLGNIDYGIYNVLAGLVTIFSSLNTVLSLSVQRFYSVALGRNNPKEMSEVFSASININLMFVLGIVVLSEIFGLWFIYNKMVLPADRLYAAVECFHFSLFSFICTFIQVPFLAAIISKENMGIFALVSTIECILKLSVAAFIPVVNIDGLLFYSCGLAFTSIFIVVSYVVICRFRYSECRYMKVNKRSLYKDLLSFSGWTVYGSMANVGLIQGNTILLNMFFGPLINMAFAIALQINNAFSALSNTIMMAFRPAIVKSYTAGNYDYVNKLFNVGNKLMLYLLMCIAIPMIVEMEAILHIWLGKVTSDVVLFARLAILYVICLAMNNPITAIIQAIGKVRAYHIRVDTITLLCLPLSWCLFKCNFPAYSVFFSMIGLCVIAHIERLICLHKYYETFSIRDYFIKLLLPAIPIALFTFFFVYMINVYIENGILEILVVFASSVFFCMAITVLIGTNKHEKTYITKYIKSSIRSLSWVRH